MKKLLVCLLILGVSVSAFAAAHPKLVEAQQALAVAADKIAAAEKSREFDKGGWAKRAMLAINNAHREIKAASQAADGRFAREVGALESVSPEVDGFFRKHPNLAEAQRYVNEAYRLVGEAQKENGFDRAGHAKKAKEFLEEASADIRKAAEGRR